MTMQCNLQKYVGKCVSLCFRLILPLLFQSIHAQQLAFPTAIGAGAYASGGRGGSVSIVTNLNDSGPGSLRSFSNTSNTTIIFNVSGVINTTSSLDFTGDNVTFAGQTAPDGGITIDGSRTFFRGNNVIVRFMRFRGGVDDNNDSVGGYYMNSAIFDHCSFSFGGDEAISIIVDTPSETGGDITMQYCFIAESSTGGIFGGEEAPDNVSDITFYGNVWYNISHRFPNLNSNGRYDIINNYVHNHSKRMIRGNFAYQINEINNLYDYGLNRVWDETLNHHGCNAGESNPLIYTSGNELVGNESTFDDETVTSTIAEMNSNNNLIWRYFYDNNPHCGTGLKNRGDQLEAFFFRDLPFNIMGNVPVIYNSSNLINEIVPSAGASKRLNGDGSVSDGNDVLDANWRNQILNGNYVPELNEANYTVPTIVSSQRAADYDTDNDGMADVWEIATFGNLNRDGTDDSNNDGYSDLEDFLNSVDDAESIPVVDVTGVNVTPETAEIQIPETLNLTATITPTNATNQTGVWTSSDPTLATVDANGVVTAVGVGVVIITFTTNDGGFTDTSEITVLPEAFEANAGPDQTICLGESTTLSASGGTNYLWDNGETTASIEVSPTETTTYTVIVADDFGNEDTDTVTVTVTPLPNANAGEDQTICDGETITLIATGGESYLWGNGETTASIEVSPTADTIYTVEVFSNNCSNTDDVNVFVNPSPNIVVTDDVVLVEGNSATLGVSGSDNYLWSTGETTPFITVSPLVTTTYTVTSLGNNGCSRTDEILVTVIPEVVADAGNDATICAGETITLTATGGSTYLWDTGQTTAQIEVSPTITTTYTVTVEDDYGYTDSDTVTITVNETPDISVSADVAIFEGETVTLTASGGDNYLWSTGETTASINVSPNNTTTYTVISTAVGGCADIEQVVVTIIPELIADAGEDQTICSGESVTLLASGGIDYTWNTGETTAEITVNPEATTTYTVSVEDAWGFTDTDSVTITVNATPVLSISENVTIIEGESATLSVSGADTYIWSNGSNTNVINVNPIATTTYTVTGSSNNGCDAVAEVTVTVEPMFVASAGEDERVCQDDNYEVILTATPGDSYLWNTGETTQSITVSPSATSTYSVVVTQGNQEATDDVTVFVDPNPDVVIMNGDSVNIMAGDFVTLTASGANTYEWNNGATQPNIAVSPSQTTTYEVTGFINDCYDEKQVVVNVIPEVIADAGDDVEICVGDTITLTATGGDEYEWSTGESTQSIEVSPAETTNYTVIVFNALDFDEDNVTVFVDALCNETVPVDPDDGEALDFSFTVFPNPSSDIVNVRLSGSDALSRIYLYDMTGKLIHSEIITNENLSVTTTRQIDVKSLHPGLYYVKLIDLNRDISKKLIVR